MEGERLNKSDRDNLMVSDLEALYLRLSKIKVEKGMLWFGFSGSWRKTNRDIEKRVREYVRKIIERGDGIVSGGALNVDFFATDEALKLNPAADRIKIFLSVTLDLYAAHYRRRAVEGIITFVQAETLISQLESLHAINPSALIGNSKNMIVDQRTYFERNEEIVNASDALVGFQVNNSLGVEDSVERAIAHGKPVYLEKFVVE